MVDVQGAHEVAQVKRKTLSELVPKPEPEKPPEKPDEEDVETEKIVSSSRRPMRSCRLVIKQEKIEALSLPVPTAEQIEVHAGSVFSVK